VDSNNVHQLVSENTFLGNFSVRSLQNWTLENAKATVNYVYPENVLQYLDRPCVFLFVDMLDDVYVVEDLIFTFYSSFVKFRRNSAEPLNFVYTDGIWFKPFRERLGLTHIPSVALIDGSKEKHYLFNNTLEYNSNNLVNFYNEVVSGSYSHFTQHSKSVLASIITHYSKTGNDDVAGLKMGEHERLRQDQMHMVVNHQDLTDLLPSNFETIKNGISRDILSTDEKNLQEVVAAGGNKSVLVNFHLPWCGFCKSVMSAFQHLAAVVADLPVLFAEYDVSRSGLNDIIRSTNNNNNDNILVNTTNQVPRIVLFKNISCVIPFVDNPSFQDLHNFIKQHAST